MIAGSGSAAASCPAIVGGSCRLHLPKFCTNSAVALKQWGGRKSSPLRCAATSIDSDSAFELEVKVSDIKEKYMKWEWRGHSINYLCSNGNPSASPLLLVHGFGASIPHWRRNIGVLSQSYTVYAIDLLGFGASDKPAGFAYTMEAWSQLILDFIAEIVQKPTVLIGNSVGSLACVIAASGGSLSAIDI